MAIKLVGAWYKQLVAMGITIWMHMLVLPTHVHPKG